MTQPYLLWGTPHSLYTGKVRSYLIKKGLLFEERMPHDARCREVIQPRVRLKVVPIVETPEGEVLQDTTAMLDRLEATAPGPAMVPQTALMRFTAEVLDAFGTEFLLPAAMHYRWSYRDQQERFLQAEFGRMTYRRSDRDAQRSAGVSAMAYFSGFLPHLGVSEETIPAIEAAYLELLEVLDRHFHAHPYRLGGRPSVADFGMMAPLFAHLGRDPVPSRIMKLEAPHVFRWTERMNSPGFADGEFSGRRPAFFDDDELPDTLKDVVTLAFAEITPEYAAHVAAYNAWVDGLADPRPGLIVDMSARPSRPQDSTG